MTRFEGKVALVTGAASGIGRAVTVRLASEGAAVFATDLNGAGLEETARLAGEAGGGAVTVHRADITAPGAARDLVAACVAAHGRLDVLGNVAGIARGEHVLDVQPEQYRLMMAVNVDACFFLAQAAIPHLLESSGNIVNMASNAGLMGQAYTVAYCMSKGAVIQMTKALAMEFAKTSMRVNAIAPGGVDTPLAHGYQAPSNVDFDLMRPYVGHRGMATADEIAAMFAFVASGDGRSIHGAVISVDNGITAS
jgi:meso-butanediol dehydrogenase / (S,S)-butanediol dehydrogenase / diacetyl reductase